MLKYCMLGFALLTSAPAWGGAIIYNGFLPGDTYSNTRGDFGKFGSNDYIKEAAAFTAPYASALTTIDIALGYRQGPNLVTVSLFSDNAGVPGVPIETFLLSNVVQPTGTHGSIITLDSTLHPILTGGAQYWIEVEVPDPAATSMSWWWADDPPRPGATRAQSWDGGAWGLDDGDMAFRVSANPVPEPSTLFLCGLGVLALLTTVWRRGLRTAAN